MTEEEQQLLGKIDERTRLMQRDTTEIKEHLIKLNGFVIVHEHRISTVEERSKTNEEQSRNNRTFINQMIISIAAAITATLIVLFLKVLGG